MVKWNNAWLQRLDSNGVPFRMWASKFSSTHAICKLCNEELKYEKQGMYCMTQHSSTKKHIDASKIAFSKDVRRFVVSSTASSASSEQKSVMSGNGESSSSNINGCSTKGVGIPLLSPSLNDQVTSAEASWLFKVAENDLSLRNCDNISELFIKMFPDSDVAKEFNLSKSKASYVLQDGLGPVLAKWLCKDVSMIDGLFSLMFDETTTNKNEKQMDVLLRFWCKQKDLVVTKFLGSLFLLIMAPRQPFLYVHL